MSIENHVCPRCLGYIPSNQRPGAYPGALSRSDNETEICSDCGFEEATLLVTGKDEWPIQVFYGEPHATGAKNRAWQRRELKSV